MFQNKQKNTRAASIIELRRVGLPKGYLKKLRGGKKTKNSFGSSHVQRETHEVERKIGLARRRKKSLLQGDK